MSKTPPIDADDFYSAIKGDRPVADAKNPFSELVAKFSEDDDEMKGIEMSPSFQSIHDENPIEPIKDSASDVETIDVAALREADANETDTEDLEDQIAIPVRAGEGRSPVSGSVGIEALAPVNENSPAKPRSLRGFMAGAAVLLAVVGTGFLYMKSSEIALSETVVYAVPVFDDEMTTDTASSPRAASISEAPPIFAAEDITPTAKQSIVVNEPSEPGMVQETPMQVIAAVTPPPTVLSTKPPTKPKPFGFDDKFSAEFPELEGQSLLDLATGVASFAPADIVPDREWSEASCGDCHSFNQANLCEQGAYYFNHDKERIARIQHPYGGGFKTKLMQWAESGCR